MALPAPPLCRMDRATYPHGFYQSKERLLLSTGFLHYRYLLLDTGTGFSIDEI
jgi:hypothetical protein